MLLATTAASSLPFFFFLQDYFLQCTERVRGYRKALIIPLKPGWTSQV